MNLTDQRASREGRGVRVRRVSVTDPIAAARHYDYPPRGWLAEHERVDLGPGRRG